MPPEQPSVIASDDRDHPVQQSTKAAVTVSADTPAALSSVTITSSSRSSPPPSRGSSPHILAKSSAIGAAMNAGASSVGTTLTNTTTTTTTTGNTINSPRTPGSYPAKNLQQIVAGGSGSHTNNRNSIQLNNSSKGGNGAQRTPAIMSTSSSSSHPTSHYYPSSTTKSQPPHLPHRLSSNFTSGRPHSPYSSGGFAIPTSNSRPGSPTGTGMNGGGMTTMDDFNQMGGADISSGGSNGAARNGYSTGWNPSAVGVATGAVSSSGTSTGYQQPPMKKRRLSTLERPTGPTPNTGTAYHLPPGSHPYQMQQQHLPQASSSSSANARSSTPSSRPGKGPTNFLAGLRGAEELGSGPLDLLHMQQTQSNAQQQQQRKMSTPNDDQGNFDGDGDDGDQDDDDDDEEDSEDSESSALPQGQGRASKSGRAGSMVGSGRGGKNGKKKMKLTRGSRACTVCRRLKMKCVEADIDNGVRCLRCRNGNLECVFEESMRGKRSSKGKKSEIMAKNLKDMENTLDTVLKSMHDPTLGLASAMTNLSPVNLNAVLDRSPAHDMMSPGKDLMGADQIDAHDPYTDGSVVNPSRPGISPMSMNHSESSPSHTGNSFARPLSRLNTSTPKIPLRNGPPSPRLHSLPDNTLNPLGLLAEASLQNRKRAARNGTAEPGEASLPSIESGLNGADLLKNRLMGKGGIKREASEETPLDTRKLGLVDASYFKPGPMTSLGLRRVIIERELKPEIFSFTTALQINELFDIYFANLHYAVPVLNREIHTPAGVCARSPFLLTVICALAARFHPDHLVLRPKLAAVAKKLMWTSPARGYKSIEIVQAYLLIVAWTLGPEERWEQDLSYLLLGMAIRIATDMNLYKKNVVMPLDTEEGRLRDIEIANRERTWLLCFIFDRSQSAQMGRPYSIREDVIIRESRHSSWYSRPCSQPEDIVLAAYADLQRIMSRALDTLYLQQTTNASGLVPGIDYPLVVNAVIGQLDAWLREWQFQDAKPNVNDLNDINMDEVRRYRSMADFYHQYNVLVLSSFSLQYAIEGSPLDLPTWFYKVYSAATGVLAEVKNTMAPKGILRFNSDGQMVMICYAVSRQVQQSTGERSLIVLLCCVKCLSLLKLIRPEFLHLHRDPQAVIGQLNEMIEILSAAAVDDYHSVGLYASLLRNLVGNKQEELRTDWTTSDKETRNVAQPRPVNNLATVCNGALTMRGNEDEGLLWNPYAGLNVQDLPQQNLNIPIPNGQPVIVPNVSEPMHSNNDPQGSSAMAMNGTIWPHAAISAAATPTAEMHHEQSMSHLNGIQENNGMFMDGLGAMQFGLEDINWENSLLMPGFGGFGQLELSGGFVHTQFGSGIISPNIGMTPAHSRPATPRHMPSSLGQ